MASYRACCCHHTSYVADQGSPSNVASSLTGAASLLPLAASSRSLARASFRAAALARDAARMSLAPRDASAGSKGLYPGRKRVVSASSSLRLRGLGDVGGGGLGVLPKFGSRGWFLVERPQAPSPPRRVRELLDRRKRNLHHLRAHSGRLSGRRRDVHQLRVHALGRSGHLLELEGTRGERGWRRRGDLAPPRRWRRYLAQHARIGASTISLVEPLALIVTPAPPPLVLCLPRCPHTLLCASG